MHPVGACSGTLNALSVGQTARTQGILQCMGMACLNPHADPCSCIAVETAIPSVVILGRAVEPPAADAVGLAQLLGQQPVARGGAGAFLPPAALFYADGQPPMEVEPPAAVEPPTAGLWGGFLVLSGPGGHVVGSTQPVVAAESVVDVDGVLGATQPSVFECLLSGKSVELAVVP